MIAHDGIGIDRDSEAFGDESDPLFDPSLAVLEGSAAVVIDAAEEGAPHAALHAVEGAGAVMRCDVRSGSGHAPVSRKPDEGNVGELLMMLSGKSDLWVSWFLWSGKSDLWVSWFLAIKLGHDTDTTACIAGGIAGLRFGLEGIPQRWCDDLRGQDLLAPLLAGLLAHRASPGAH